MIARMSQSPYDRPSDPAKRISRALTDGPDRAPARSYFKAIGFTDEDLAKPLVGVATTWIETMPCNLNQRYLAQAVKQGVRDAGGFQGLFEVGEFLLDFAEHAGHVQKLVAFAVLAHFVEEELELLGAE